MSYELRVAKDHDALTRDAAETFAEAAAQAVRARGRFSVALSGGTTPRALYTMLGRPGFRERVAWARAHVFWGDERCVPPDHEQSTFRMVSETLLSHVEVPAANVHRIEAERPDPEEAADAYERVLRQEARATGRQSPRFDLMLLGMGSDGHTAGLFPGTEAVGVSDRLVVASWVEALKAHRISMTVPALGDAEHVLFLVSGEAKAATLRNVLEGPPTVTLPASLIRPRDGRLTWLVDEQAARLLRPRQGTP